MALSLRVMLHPSIILENNDLLNDDLTPDPSTPSQLQVWVKTAVIIRLCKIGCM
jgi:hypothetical protein